MLRSEHSIVRYDFDKRTVTPDRLRRHRDESYVGAIENCLQIYRDGIGRTRQELHRNVEQSLSTIVGCPPRRMAAFCKLLDDLGDFSVNSKACVALRRAVFEFAAQRHPLVTQREGIFEHDTTSVRSDLAASLGKPWTEIESAMFADVIELQPLRSFETSIGATELLSIYNLAQTQAALFRATAIRVDAWSDFKTIIGHAKLARLMHRIDRLDRPRPGYRFYFDGPGSTLRETTRYGIGFAKLLGRLVGCRDWHLTARVLGPRKQPMHLVVGAKSGLRSVLGVPAPYDSALEEEVEQIWRRDPVERWQLERESELLYIGQTVLTPDFVLRSHDGRIVYVEVVGFWTPEYLVEKFRRLKQFREAFPKHRWLLMFPRTLAEKATEMGSQLGVATVILDRRESPRDWIDAIEERCN